MKELECEFFIYDMLVKEKLYKKNIKFRRVIFSSSTSETICMMYNCPHKINIQHIGKINVSGVDSENPVCQVCDDLLRKISVPFSGQKLYYIPDYVA